MGRPSLRFDEKLFDLKMAGLFPEIYGLAVDVTPFEEALAIQEGSEEASRGAYEVRLLDRYFARLLEQLREIDRVAREVWQIQGEAVTPDFVWEILFPKAMTAIEAWLKKLTHTSAARDLTVPYAARFRHFAVIEIPKLRRDIRARYEIEARTLEHKQAHKPKPKLAEPINPVNTGFTSVSLTKALAPPREVGGRGDAGYEPEPAEVPHEPPGGGLRNTGEAEHRAKPEVSTERADQSVLPTGLCGVGDPEDGNPFPPGNPRYAHWQQATLKAEEELCLLNVQFMKNSPTRERFAEWMQRGGPYSAERELAAWTLNFVAARFDIWAKRACHVVWDEHDLKVFDKWLFDYAESWLRAERDAGRDAILRELRARLIERMEYWKAAARGTLSELRRVEAENSGKTGQAVESKPKGGPREPGQTTGADRLRTGGKQTQSPLVENNGKTARSAENKPTTALPQTWSELRERYSITQKEAAGYLRCHTKTVGRLAKANELTKSQKKRIICDERLRNQIRKVHGRHVLP